MKQQTYLRTQHERSKGTLMQRRQHASRANASTLKIISTPDRPFFQLDRQWPYERSKPSNPDKKQAIERASAEIEKYLDGLILDGEDATSAGNLVQILSEQDEPVVILDEQKSSDHSG